jgi:hypothetical protein
VADETTIAVLPADREDRRLRVVLLAGEQADGSRLRLSDETYSEDVGWFAQGHIDLSPEQIRGLRAALGAAEPRGGQRTARLRASQFEPATEAEERGAVLLSLVRAG